MTQRTDRVALVAALAWMAGASSVCAQPGLTQADSAQIVREAPGLDLIDVEEKLEAQLPLDIAFTDHTGKSVRLRDYFDGERPVLLNFAYHTCPTLCSFVLDATVNVAKDLEWTAGDEFTIVTISIDPEETVEAAANKRREILAKYGRAEAERGWPFLVGDADAIEAATDAAGYRYFYNANQDQYMHPAAIMFMTPEGRFARYLYGIQFNAGDARFALLEAAEGRAVVNATERFLMYCYAYDAEANTYTLVAMNVMKAGGALTILVLGTFLTLMLRRDRRRSRAQDAALVNRTSDRFRSAVAEPAKAEA
ncbi:MAG: SCO family protein [Myxococcota bacterium]